MSIELTLDASISFGRRQSTRLWSNSARSDVHEQEKYDFLALIIAIANLYSQNDILEMQGRQDTAYSSSNGQNRSCFIQTADAMIKQPSGALFQKFRYSVTEASDNIPILLRSLESTGIIGIPSLLDTDPFGVLLGIPRALDPPRESKYGFEKVSSQKAIALNIACGLSAIHECGVIHGDLKPANVLIFFKPVLHAKIADFSHSFLDTGEQRQLIGGTRIYAAPEWQASASTGQLRKVDIYSLGLVLSGLVLGTDLIDCFERNPPRLNLNLSLADSIQKVKDDDLMVTYLYELIYLADKQNPDLHLDSLPMIRSILESTLQLDPGKRHLDKVIHLLSSRYSQPTPF
ncbi:kinase-like domain-containing protein [Fusarium oxysporum Fo47]|uniref:kinase-like domain-containing protein n=1 Tax=Fusarium oxysporum Fo47 TaxID=660027 RepID=UPI002869C728|nr:kinase-like domain-containing protein [Fusarium oxysporum Fo47]WJG34382.1 kinase-like domain-containing protein [Fusarium oxysporum Fo47]